MILYPEPSLSHAALCIDCWGNWVRVSVCLSTSGLFPLSVSSFWFRYLYLTLLSDGYFLFSLICFFALNFVYEFKLYMALIKPLYEEISVIIFITLFCYQHYYQNYYYY